MEHTISTPVLQAIINYLEARPYKETVALLKGISDTAKPVVDNSVHTATPPGSNPESER